MKITYSDQALEQTNVPKKVHHIKRWSINRCYHKRIQKKLIKRFGWIMKPAIFKTPYGIIAHPAFRTSIEANNNYGQ